MCFPGLSHCNHWIGSLRADPIPIGIGPFLSKLPALSSQVAQWLLTGLKVFCVKFMEFRNFLFKWVFSV